MSIPNSYSNVMDGMDINSFSNQITNNIFLRDIKDNIHEENITVTNSGNYQMDMDKYVSHMSNFENKRIPVEAFSNRAIKQLNSAGLQSNKKWKKHPFEGYCMPISKNNTNTEWWSSLEECQNSSLGSIKLIINNNTIHINIIPNYHKLLGRVIKIIINNKTYNRTVNYVKKINNETILLSVEESLELQSSPIELNSQISNNSLSSSIYLYNNVQTSIEKSTNNIFPSASF